MYDLDKIKEIPCTDICQKYGINLKFSNGRWWGKIRPEDKTPSFSIRDNNLWYDFGLAKGGSNIELVSELESIDRNAAIKRIADMYGINDEKTNGWSALTDNQYRDIGIQPEKATMNFNIDLNKHSLEQVEEWYNKYGIHVKELAEKYPKIYNKLLYNKSFPQINELRDSYYHFVKQANDTEPSPTKDLYILAAKEKNIDINRKVDLLQKAIIGKVDLANLKVNAENELDKVFEKNLNINGQQFTRDEIISIVKNHIECLKSNNELEGLEFEIVDADVYGSRNNGTEHKKSDLDIVLEYKGDVREDDMFSALNREPLEINEIRVDINPISTSKSGSLKEYLHKLNSQNNSNKGTVSEEKTIKSINQEIGKIPYNILKNEPGINRYLLIDDNEFEKLKASKKIRYSAFTKEKGVNIVVKEHDLKSVLETIQRNYGLTLGNIKYKELKAMGELMSKEYNIKIAQKIIGNAVKNDIKIYAFNNGQNKINIVFQKKDFKKFNTIANKVKGSLNINRGKER